MIPFLHGALATNGGVASDFELIETQTVGAGGAASVTFSSIPGTYKHLQIRGIGRATSAVRGDIRFNADSGNNYATHELYGDGTSAASTNATSVSVVAVLRAIYFPTGSNIFGGLVADILDYSSTAKNKTIRVLAGSDINSSGGVSLDSGLWMNTAAITSVTLSLNGADWTQYSTFSLYGVK